MRFIIMLLPWLELFTLIQLGIETSALTAIAYVVFTVFLGLAIIRRQGMDIFNRLRNAQSGRVVGSQLLVDDLAMGFAGALLVFPGIISDVVALFVVIGPLRRVIARALGVVQPEAYVPGRDTTGEDVIEGQFRHVEDRDSL